MSGRGWRKWRSGGLYIGNHGWKQALKKSTHSHSEEHVTLCGRSHGIANFTPLSKSTWHISKKQKNINGSRSVASVGEDKGNEEVIEWVDRRSELPPSLGWYSPRGGCSTGYYEDSFKQSLKKRSIERSLERLLDRSFQKRRSSDSLEENGNLSYYDDVILDVGSDDDFQDAQPKTSSRRNNSNSNNNHYVNNTNHSRSSDSSNNLGNSNGNKKLQHQNGYANSRQHSNVPNLSSRTGPKNDLRRLSNRSEKKDYFDTKVSPSAVFNESRKIFNHTDQSIGTADSPLRQHHVWTSRDLRQYLVLKAKAKLGDPENLCPCDSSSPSSYLQDKDEKHFTIQTLKNLKFSTTVKLPCALNGSSTATPSLNVKSGEKSNKNSKTIKRLPKEQILSWGGTHFPRDSSTRNSLRLQRPQPAPRPRLWSLPAIILTPSEDSISSSNSSPTPPPSPSATSRHSRTSMQFLQVPRLGPSPVRRTHSLEEQPSSESPSVTGSSEKKPRSRNSSPKDLAKRNRTGSLFPAFKPEIQEMSASASAPSESSQSDTLDDIPPDALAYLRSGRRPSQLDSILSLYCDSSEEDDDSEFGMYSARSGSPPPDKRPALEDFFGCDFEEAIMYGRYSSNLAEYARQESRRLRDEERNKDELLFSKELQPYRGRIGRIIIKLIRPVWDYTFARVGEDWVFLFFLGLILATFSFLTDYVIFICFKARMYLNDDLLYNIHWTLQLFAWVTIPTLLVIFSAAFCQWLAPSAAGSGIPEMKTILRGVILKEYLTWKTLVAKIVGLATVIGAGLPLGKEGPVMHMASIVSTMLMNLLSWIKGVVDSEAHTTDLLAASCTMGVAVCYAAPIGGVLFSIEVTAVYFAVRNYWRGFFAAVVGAMFYRLMSVWFMNEETIYPLFKVEHNFIFPYDVIELLPFLCIGIVCGFAGSLFVLLHRRYVLFIRQNKTVKRLLNKKRLLYPTIISILVSTMTFPLALGQFMASTITTKQQILDLFSNVTWTVLPDEPMTMQQQNILRNWGLSTNTNFHVSLFLFQIITIFQIGISSTLPVPNGLLIPLFKVGAALGRQVGEIMVYLYPHGLHMGHPIIPGAYAMVGAASFCASITHTISISVIAFELTGQITYVIPIMIGVLISNCIASLLQPSIYDSVIRIKKLPYLPDIVSTSSDVYNIYVEDIMVRDVKYIWYGITYMDLKRVIKENRKLKYFPVVDKHESMILLGSIPRVELVRILVEQISSEKRRKEAKSRHLEALKKKWEEEDAQGITSKTSSKLRYENELNLSSDEEEEDAHKHRLFRGLSRSLSRSISRSRSLTRSLSRSQSASRLKGPESSSDESDDSSTKKEEDKKHSDSDSSPPSSPSASKLRGLFPEDTPFQRDETRFSVTRADTDSKIEQSAESEENPEAPATTDVVDARPEEASELKPPADETEGKRQKEGPKKKSRLEQLKQTTKSKMKTKKTFEQKRKVHMTRSNSLDDMRPSTSEKSDVVESLDLSQPRKQLDFPKKGILKRRNSLSLGSLPTATSFLSPPDESSYQTVTVIDTKLRNAIEKVRRMKMETASSMELKLSQLSLFKSKKKDNGKKQEFDLSPDDREVWELRELSKEVDFSKCHIDPSPFQLVERTSLLRVHSLFSMLGINHAFVTAIGRLVGVVAIKELRQAIEGQYVGQTATSQKNNAQSSVKGSSPSSPSHLSQGPSPQMMSIVPPLSPLDPEAGTVIKRPSSNTKLSPFTNGGYTMNE